MSTYGGNVLTRGVLPTLTISRDLWDGVCPWPFKCLLTPPKVLSKRRGGEWSSTPAKASVVPDIYPPGAGGSLGHMAGQERAGRFEVAHRQNPREGECMPVCEPLMVKGPVSRPRI